MTVAFEILGKRCGIGERLVDLNGVSRPPVKRAAPRNLLPGRGGEQLLVQGREATRDLRPAISSERVGQRARRSSSPRAAVRSALTSGSSWSGRMSQPVAPSATIAAGPCTLQAITGGPQAIASTRTSPNAWGA